MRTSTITPIILLSLALAGCSLLGLGEDEGGSSTEENIAHYEQVRLDLEVNREAILPGFGVDDINAVNDYLTWLDITQGWEAQLHIRHYPEGTDIIASVTIGDEMTTPFYRLDDKFAMTALTGMTDSIYKIIDLQTGDLVEEVTHKKPQTASYDAYGIRGDQAYLVVEDEGKMIYEWDVGTGSPIAIGAIDDTSANLGAWIDFTLVEFGGSRKLLALGTYGTYTIDLDTMVATQVPLPITPLEIGITDVGIAAIDGFDLWFVGWGDTEARAIHDELKESSYALNSTFEKAHWVGSGTANVDVSMDGELIYYNSVAGIYAYGVNSGTIEPVLLNRAGYDQTEDPKVYVQYTGITLARDVMYVVGLESPDGSSGSDGKIYRVLQ
ncbi:hypothetical protein DB30_01904 [Enhygromyxa salina]|uniref:Lipoprotein n=1 Tax=Enhygromyxa salina TaxID=215803 RepID=A0A0C2DEC3_9BACT|nr:hypothetical protein [Enhygromyxa salina]KIG18017.1 hypothetical protein DB30_01904 [Enhygromyxa salina]